MRRQLVELLAWVGGRYGKAPGLERIVRAVCPPGDFEAGSTICVARDSSLFCAYPNTTVGWNVAFFGTYEPELRAILKSVLVPGAVAVDVGANVGWHTLLMSRLVGDGGLVLAAEPNPSIVRCLQSNLRLNRIGNVTVLPVAIAAASGVAEFWAPAASETASGDGHLVSGGGPDGAVRVQVETRTLDAILHEAGASRLDFIKIDVEGFEWQVLQGALDSLERFRPQVYFEFNEEYSGRGGGSSKAFGAFFTRLGYRLFVPRRGWAEELDPAGAWPQCGEIWAVPRE